MPSLEFEHFLVGKTLGHGSYGIVKQATDIRTQKQVALKIMSVNSRTKKIIETESYLTSTLKHANIAQLFEVKENKRDGTVCLVMELINGCDLFDLIEKTTLTEAEARTLFSQIVDALDYCHSQGIVHRDLKPENILVDRQGNAKIIDWGLGASLKKGEKLIGFVGSAEYAAPEVHCKKHYTEAIDCWSLGVLLYVLVERLFPWDGATHEEIIQKIKQADFVPPVRASSSCKDLIANLLQVDASKRFTTKDILNHPWLKKSK